MLVITKIEAKKFQDDLHFVEFESVDFKPKSVSFGKVEPQDFTTGTRERVDGIKVKIDGKLHRVGFTKEANSVFNIESLAKELRKTQCLLDLEMTKYGEVATKYNHTKAYIKEFQDASFFKRLIYLFTKELPE